MHASTPLLLASAALCGLVPRLAGQADAPQLGHWSCESEGAQSTIYPSAVWDGAAKMDEVTNAYTQVLQSKYGYKGRIFCSMAYMSGSTLAGLQAGKQQQFSQWEKSGKKVVQTGWTYAPAMVSLPYYCSGAVRVQKAGQSTYYFYLTGLIRIRGNSADSLVAAWRDYTAALHPGFLFNPNHCNLFPPDQASQQTQLNGMLEQWKANNYQITPVDWTYQPGQAAAPTEADRGASYYCQMLSADGKSWYVSGVYPVDPHWAPRAYVPAWGSYATKTLKLEPAVYRGGCDEGPMKASLQARAARKEQINGLEGAKVVEVDWKYAPGQEAASAPTPSSAAASDAPATSAPPASSAAPAAEPSHRILANNAPTPLERSYFCQYDSRPRQGQVIRYLSEVFTSTTPQPALRTAWQQYIAATYHPEAPAPGICMQLGGSAAQQQRTLENLERSLKAAKIEVVQVKWKP